MDVTPVTIHGDYVCLESLSRAVHLDDLQRAGAHLEIFCWFTEDYSSSNRMCEFVDEAVDTREQRKALPFATVLQDTGEAIGSTRFGNIAPAHRCVEIGWTWLTPDQQRTRANTESKYLILSQTFETWGYARVELKTDSRNRRSIAAIRRIGGTEEGTPRDTVYFSILADEWPSVKEDLEAKLSGS